jgi:magnesium transporter
LLFTNIYFCQIASEKKMITIFKTTKDGLMQTRKFEKGCWVNLTNPTKEELDRTTNELHIPLDFLTDPLDSEERARVEVDEKIALIVLRIPRFEGDTAEVHYTTLPIGIIFTQDLLITICSKETDILSEFTNNDVKKFSTKEKKRFMLQIFLRASLIYHKYLKEINKMTNTTEKELHKAMKNEELIKLLNIEKSLVFFTTSLKSNELMMERLQKLRYFQFSEEDKDLIEDVTIEYKQAIEMANVYSNILSGMMDAFASVISNNLNVILKFLTSVTIILMIPTLIASIYGMNVELPFQHSRDAFLITMVLSFVFSIIGVIIFWKRKWF